jgi:ribosomal protein S18 acetylase RimI-like enzyme
MSKRVARKVTPQLWHTATVYGFDVVTIRNLEAGDVAGVVERIVARLRDDATRNPLINPDLSVDVLAESLAGATSSTWVALDGDRVVGHLYGALLENDTYGHGVWIGPDGASFDDADVLASLYATAGQSWIDAGAMEHYVWVLDDSELTDAWFELGFARMHRRGVLALDRRRAAQLPAGYSIRPGTLADIDIAVSLIEEIDRAQVAGPSFSINLSTASERQDLVETLEDPEVRYYLVESGGAPVGQCITYPLPERRGSFESTLHLSAVSVRPAHRGHGVAEALVDTALNDGFDDGFSHVETNWRVTNHRAARYWTNYGFAVTYVRLHRTIGPT